MLSDVKESASIVPLKRLGELLRILIHVTVPFQDQPTHLRALDGSLQEEFLKLLHSKIARLEVSLIADQPSANSEHKIDLILLLRLLQFILNFGETNWSPGMKEAGASITSVLFRLLMVRLHGYLSRMVLMDIAALWRWFDGG